MKKKIVMVTLSLLMAMSAITGCGKSDEEKARDEIMSHMDADEKANIAADQQAIADYEASKQAEAEALANEEPVDYSEVLVEKSLNDFDFSTDSYDFVLPYDINVLAPSDDYFSKKTSSNGYLYGRTRTEMTLALSKLHLSELNLTDGNCFKNASLIGECNGISVYTYTEDYLADIFVCDGSDNLLLIRVSSIDANFDMLKKICEKNADYILEQIESQK